MSRLLVLVVLVVLTAAAHAATYMYSASAGLFFDADGLAPSIAAPASAWQRGAVFSSTGSQYINTLADEPTWLPVEGTCVFSGTMLVCRDDPLFVDAVADNIECWREAAPPFSLYMVNGTEGDCVVDVLGDTVLWRSSGFRELVWNGTVALSADGAQYVHLASNVTLVQFPPATTWLARLDTTAWDDVSKTLLEFPDDCAPGAQPAPTVLCSPCPPGSYRAPPLLFCAPCPAGTFSIGFGSVTCTPCPDPTACPAGSALMSALRENTTVVETPVVETQQEVDYNVSALFATAMWIAIIYIGLLVVSWALIHTAPPSWHQRGWVRKIDFFGNGKTFAGVGAAHFVCFLAGVIVFAIFTITFLASGQNYRVIVDTEAPPSPGTLAAEFEATLVARIAASYPTLVGPGTEWQTLADNATTTLNVYTSTSDETVPPLQWFVVEIVSLAASAGCNLTWVHMMPRPQPFDIMTLPLQYVAHVRVPYLRSYAFDTTTSVPLSFVNFDRLVKTVEEPRPGENHHRLLAPLDVVSEETTTTTTTTTAAGPPRTSVAITLQPAPSPDQVTIRVRYDVQQKPLWVVFVAIMITIGLWQFLRGSYKCFWKSRTAMQRRGSTLHTNLRS